MEKKFERIKKIVEKKLSCSAHKMDHIMRVYNLCLRLARGEKVNLAVLKAAALLHDIGRAEEDKDKSGATDHAIAGAKMSAPILKKLKFSSNEIKHIEHCILTHRYRAGRRPETLEAKILFDADKLDSLGAIGIARAFVWVGKNEANIYKMLDKAYIKDNLNGNAHGRIKDKTKHSPQIEFETKLKFLEDKLYTKKAKKIGKERMKYLKNFMYRLEKEIKGEL